MSPETLFDQLTKKQGTCYLNLDNETLQWWNFLSDGKPLLNTRLLFRAAVWPHFDYFFSRVEWFSKVSPEQLNGIRNEKFRAMVGQAQGGVINHEEVTKFNFSSYYFHPVIISSRPGKYLPSARTIQVKGVDVFGDVEPVWRSIRAHLPGDADIFFLSMGPEKVLYGPRLAMLTGKPVVDLYEPPKSEVSLLKKFKKFITKLKYPV